MSEFEPLDLDDVVLSGGTRDILGHSTAQIKELFEALKEQFSGSHPQSELLDGKFECQVLSSTNNRTGWMKGKLRLHMALEFCPDEPEMRASPESNDLLDEFR